MHEEMPGQGAVAPQEERLLFPDDLVHLGDGNLGPWAIRRFRTEADLQPLFTAYVDERVLLFGKLRNQCFLLAAGLISPAAILTRTGVN
jgi:hypothetical protein